MHIGNFRSTGLAFIALALSPSASVQAVEADSSVGMLEEVIVTATRRARSVNDIPIAVSAFSADDLRRASINEVKELARVTPSLSIVSGTSESGNTEIRIRGVGTNGSNPGLESSVGVFVDGVFRSRSGLAMGAMLDIDRVEVLRGPQGTLFGRNTSAGALSLHSTKPEYEWGGRVIGGVENYDGYRLEAGITGPIIDDKLAFRFSALHHERDGFVSSRTGPEEMYDRDRTRYKGQLLWDASDALEFRLIADYATTDEQCCTADYVVAGPTADVIRSLGGVVEVDPFAYKTQVNYESKDDNEERGVSLLMDWSITDDLSLRYIGGWRDNEVDTNVDGDTSNVDIVQGTNGSNDTSTNTHELQLAGQAGALDWLVGAYYYEEDIDVRWQLTFGSQFGDYFSALAGGAIPPFLFPEGAGDEARLFDQEGDGFALFTHNIFEITEKWDLVLGLRWSKDNKDASAEVINTSIHCALIPTLLCPVEPFDQSDSHSEPTGTFKLVYTTDSAIYYGSASRGYKAGGFNLDRDASATATQFDPELVNSYEIGAKLTALEGRLQVNTAIFLSDFDDFQINEFDGLSFSITNAGQAESRGIEVELNYLITSKLALNLGVTRLDTEYIKHPGFNSIGDPIEGQPLSRAPEWTGNFGLSYTDQLGEFGLRGDINANFLDDHNLGATADPQSEQDGYAIMDMRLAISSPNEHWTASAWGKNILDEEYNVAIFGTALQAGSYSAFRGQPRTYGVTLEYRY